MKRLNKKGTEMYTADTFIFYIIFSIVLSVLMIVFMLVIYNHLKDTARIPDGIEEFSAIERFQSEGCFALDSINPPKAIDWNKFTKENLDSCYNIGKESEKIAFSLNLTIGKISEKIHTLNWNEEIPPRKVKSPIDVNVYYNNEIINGKLTISEQNVQII